MRGLFVPERFRRLNTQASSRGSQCRERTDDGHHQDDERHGRRTLAVEHLAFEELLEADRAEQAGACADAELQEYAREDAGENAIAIGAKRRANADLAPAPPR
jgi:hypothetical protein